MNHYNWEYEYHSFYQEIKKVKYRYISGTKMLENKASQFQGSSKLIQNPYNYNEAILVTVDLNPIDPKEGP